MRDDLYRTVPSYFRCPISLDVMKSPVSLCTGVTYDRSSIQRWLDGGNNTCPATMQVLQNRDLVPNHTLHRLIKIWSDSVLTQPDSALINRNRAADLVNQIESDLKNASIHFSQNISRLISFAAESEDNGRLLAANGGRLLPLLTPLIGKLKGLKLLEKIVLFCNVLLVNRVKIDPEQTNALILSKIESYDFKASILMCLKQGSVELRTAVAKFLELMISNMFLEINSLKIAEDEEIYSELLRLITTCDWNPEALDASLSFLIRLVMLKRNRSKIIRAGGIKVLTAVLTAELTAPLTEKALKLLEIASSCKEGRSEICGNGKCVQAILKKVLKVSNVATEHAVTVLWSLCCLFGDKAAATAVAESNGAAKILLLLQSNCSPAVRQMCGDLLRVFGCNSKRSCISWYDTKASHIMPY